MKFQTVILDGFELGVIFQNQENVNRPYLITLDKILQFHLISWRGNFVEAHNFRRILVESPDTLRKLSISTKFPHQEITWNFGILHSARI